MKHFPSRTTRVTASAGLLSSLGALALSALPTQAANEAAPGEAMLYRDIIAPVLTARCTACHGEEKQKGKLRLDSLEHVLQGSDGENVIPGDAEQSLMTFRITLPKDDDEVMPPEDEPQLTANEIAAIEFWIASGAKGDVTVAAAKPDEATLAVLTDVLNNLPEAAVAEAAGPAVDPAVLAERKKIADQVIGRVEETGATLMAIAQDTPELRFSALNVAKDFNDDHLGVLAPAADQILWMDLARTQVTDAGLAAIGQMSALTRLHLENTGISDAGIAHLKGLANLEYLNLYGTQITDAGLMELAALPNLKKLYVWQSKVTDEGVAAAAAKAPELEINNGWKADAKAVEVAETKPEPKPEAKPEPKPATPAPKPQPTPPAPKDQPKAAPKAQDKGKDKAKAKAQPAPTPAPAAAQPTPALREAIAEAEKAAAAARKAATDASAAAQEAEENAAATQRLLEELRRSAAEEAKK